MKKRRPSLPRPTLGKRPSGGTVFLLTFLFLFPGRSAACVFVGGETVYVVKKGDTLLQIGALLGVNWQNIARGNNIDSRKVLRIGQELRVNNRKIVPKAVEEGIVINIPDRMLYFFHRGSLSAFPVGLGKPSWKTPEGVLTVTAKEKNPTWHVPISIRREMALEGHPVEDVVPPGPENPLGRYALKTSIPDILIHETIWPGTVYRFRSHGCIRVHPDNMEAFFQEVEKGTAVDIIYSPVKACLSAEGKVYLEAHPDVYKNFEDLDAEARGIIEGLGAAGRVDWQKAQAVLKDQAGVAEDVTK